MAKQASEDSDNSQGGLQRGFAIIRALANSPCEGLRLTEIATQAGLAQATAHRILRSLTLEGMVEQPEGGKSYRLSVEFFSLAARAGGRHSTLKALCRPALLRLSGMLKDTVFLLVRAGVDAICVDRVDGPLPIRSYTGDIGGRVPLGVGQAGLLMLAYMPEAEREEIIRFNVPRLHNLAYFDEIYLRASVEKTLALGYAATDHGEGPISGMAGVSVPILDQQGTAMAAISIGTLAERVNAERLPQIVKALGKEAAAISAQLNPFDPALRRPAQFLSNAAQEPWQPALQG
ncbi:IclR family transcriptional regulator [Pigmentiphaga aceris]|uniref:IclR family transcriptional regulator n=1 Tax=Pigmentiphaga aceris TaxID=1940612 RepID=A0A5C0AZQ2_9BURK|nr:IclR family transcriptional regulator [Pigmentiphaga aceris]QEI06340.1 IclR family transcriptional regulator [Pigmentiphaga aceris]